MRTEFDDHVGFSWRQCTSTWYFALMKASRSGLAAAAPAGRRLTVPQSAPPSPPVPSLASQTAAWMHTTAHTTVQGMPFRKSHS